MKKIKFLGIFIYYLLSSIIGNSQNTPDYRVRVEYSFSALPNAPSGLNSYGTLTFESGENDDGITYDLGNSYDIGLNKQGFIYASADELNTRFTQSPDDNGFARIRIPFIRGFNNYHREYVFLQHEIFEHPANTRPRFGSREFLVDDTCSTFRYEGFLGGTIRGGDSDDDNSIYNPSNINRVDTPYYSLRLLYVFISTEERLIDARSEETSFSINENITRDTFRLSSNNALNMIEVSIDDNDNDLTNNEWHTMDFFEGGRPTTWKLSDFFTEAELANEQVQFRGVVCASAQWDEDQRVYTKFNVLSDFIVESPRLSEDDTEIIRETCSYNDDGAIKLFFERDITDGLHLLYNINGADGDIVDQKRIYDLDDDLSYTINNIPAPEDGGLYTLVYTSRDNENEGDIRINQSETVERLTFFMREPSPVILNQGVINQPVCADDTGSITVLASGGKDIGFGRQNGTYQFKLLRGVEIEQDWISNSSTPTSYTFNNLEPGTYSVNTRLNVAGLEDDCSPPEPQTIVINEVTNPITKDTGTDINDASYLGATDGEITVYFSGGVGNTGDFTATISPASNISPTVTRTSARFTGLGVGTYEIEVTDRNGCPITFNNLQVESKPLPVIDNIDIITDISCIGDADGVVQADVSIVTGATISYQWRINGNIIGNSNSPRIDDLEKGIYELRVSNSPNNFTTTGAYVSSTVEIGANIATTPVSIVSINSQNASCHDDTGQVIVNVNGGTGSYEYKEGVSGTYTSLPNNGVLRYDTSSSGNILIRDSNGCVANNNNNFNVTGYTVFIPQEELILTYNSDTNQKVDNTIFGEANGSFELDLFGGYDVDPYTITFEKDGSSIPVIESARRTDIPEYNYVGGDVGELRVRNLQAGSYNVSVTDEGGCTVSLSQPIEITEPAALTIAPITVNTAIDCFGGTGILEVVANGGSEAYTYEWKRGGVTLANTDAILDNAIAGSYTVTVTDGTATTAGIVTAATTIPFNFGEPDLVVFTARPIDATCNGEPTGSIVMDVLEGGTGSYEYSIDNQGSYTTLNAATNTITGLEAGNYEVWIRDTKDCTAIDSQNVIIGEPLAITIEETLASHTNVRIRGESTGILEVSVNVGEGTLSYSWSRTLDASFSATDLRIENLFADTYTLIVTDTKIGGSTCQASSSFEVLQPEVLEVSIQETNTILCHDETTATLMATASGGFPIGAAVEDYVFIWEEVLPTGDLNELTRGNGLNLLENKGAGEYKVTVQDVNGTMATDDYTVLEPDELTIITNNIVNESCFEEKDGSITITITGGPTNGSGDYLPYTYSWTKEGDSSFSSTLANLSNVSEGIYELTITDDNDCTLIETFEVDLVSPKIEISTPVVTNLSGFEKQDGSISLMANGGTGVLNYTWTLAEDTSFTKTGANISDLVQGNYTLVVSDVSGCSQSIDVFVGEPEILIVTLTQAEENMCYDGMTADLTAAVDGGFLDEFSDYKYQWFKLNTDDVFEPIIISGTGAVLINQSFGTYKVVVTDDNGIETEAEIFTGSPDAISITLVAKEDIDCFGNETGSIDVNVTGGIVDDSGYQYQWTKIGDATFTATTQDISSIAPGEYSLLVIDANTCEFTETFIIEDIEAPLDIEEIDKINTTAEDASDGGVTIEVTGGTAPYRYSWTSSENPTFTATTQNIADVLRGLYTLEVTDANGCKETFETRIAIPGELVIENVQVGDPICFDACTGTVNLEIVGGVEPYIFNWSNGANTQNIQGLCPGIYTLEVTDRVNVSTSITVEVDNAPVLEVFLPEDITLCQGQITSINGTQPDAVSYQWTSDNGFTSNESIISVNETGVYELTITNANNCTASNTIFVEAINTLISANFIAPSQIFVNEPFIFVNISDPSPDTSEWQIPDEAIVGLRDDNYLELQFDTPGTYEIGFGANVGLCYEELVKQVVVLERTEEELNDVSVTASSYMKPVIYPNPIIDEALTLEVEASEDVALSISIYSTSSGGILINRNVAAAQEHKETFDVSNFLPGLYFVVIETKLGNQVLKLIKG